MQLFKWKAVVAGRHRVKQRHQIGVCNQGLVVAAAAHQHGHHGQDQHVHRLLQGLHAPTLFRRHGIKLFLGIGPRLAIGFVDFVIIRFDFLRAIGSQGAQPFVKQGLQAGVKKFRVCAVFDQRPAQQGQRRRTAGMQIGKQRSTRLEVGRRMRRILALRIKRAHLGTVEELLQGIQVIGATDRSGQDAGKIGVGSGHAQVGWGG